MPHSPLNELHETLGARLIDFAGWTMPLQYEGVLAEHDAVRSSVGVFDVSHLGRFSMGGDGATDVLRHLLCNDITKVEPGRAQYTMALNDAGGVEDDIIVWWLDHERFWVLPNGANFHEIVGRFIEAAPDSVSIDPIRDESVLIAVQGPQSAGVIEAVIGVVPGRFRTVEAEYNGHDVLMAGTGYTGERGAEISVPAAAGDQLFRDLLDAGAVPCGLGARDTLRLEKGYPLWGQDLDATTTPLEAGLEWVVDWDHDFVGRPALESQRTNGVNRSMIGFVLESRRVPRHGSPIAIGESTGVVSSGNFSPALEAGIGLGYVSPSTDAMDVVVTIRGEAYRATRVSPPFV